MEWYYNCYKIAEHMMQNWILPSAHFSANKHYQRNKQWRKLRQDGWHAVFQIAHQTYIATLLLSKAAATTGITVWEKNIQEIELK